MRDLHFLELTALAELIRTRAISPLEAADHLIAPLVNPET
jgi:hypothetical protein